MLQQSHDLLWYGENILKDSRINKYCIDYNKNLNNLIENLCVELSYYDVQYNNKDILINILISYIKNNNLIVGTLGFYKNIFKMVYVFDFMYINVLESNNAELMFKYKLAQLNL